MGFTARRYQDFIRMIRSKCLRWICQFRFRSVFEKLLVWRFLYGSKFSGESNNDFGMIAPEVISFAGIVFQFEQVASPLLGSNEISALPKYNFPISRMQRVVRIGVINDWRPIVCGLAEQCREQSEAVLAGFFWWVCVQEIGKRG